MLGAGAIVDAVLRSPSPVTRKLAADVPAGSVHERMQHVVKADAPGWSSRIRDSVVIVPGWLRTSVRMARLRVPAVLYGNVLQFHVQ